MTNSELDVAVSEFLSKITDDKKEELINEFKASTNRNVDMNDIILLFKISHLVYNFKTLSENEQDELIDKIKNMLYCTTTAGEIDEKDVIELLQHEGDCLYKNIEINTDNIESQLEEKLTKNFINAKGIIIGVEGSDKMTCNHNYAIADFINSIIAEDTNVIFNSLINENGEDDKLKVTIFATGITEN